MYVKTIGIDTNYTDQLFSIFHSGRRGLRNFSMMNFTVDIKQQHNSDIGTIILSLSIFFRNKYSCSSLGRDCSKEVSDFTVVVRGY